MDTTQLDRGGAAYGSRLPYPLNSTACPRCRPLCCQRASVPAIPFLEPTTAASRTAMSATSGDFDMAQRNDDPIDALDAADVVLRDILLRTRLPPDIRVAIARIIREHTSPALEREGRRQPLPR